MNYPWIAVGKKVVCIMQWHALPAYPPEEIYPIVGETYTIRNVEERQCPQTNQIRLGIRLQEVLNPWFCYEDGLTECLFDVNGFKPLITTDISVFTKMLKTKEIVE